MGRMLEVAGVRCLLVQKQSLFCSCQVLTMLRALQVDSEQMLQE